MYFCISQASKLSTEVGNVIGMLAAEVGNVIGIGMLAADVSPSM
jgi:hypothetical protein